MELYYVTMKALDKSIHDLRSHSFFLKFHLFPPNTHYINKDT